MGERFLSYTATVSLVPLVGDAETLDAAGMGSDVLIIARYRFAARALVPVRERVVLWTWRVGRW